MNPFGKVKLLDFLKASPRPDAPRAPDAPHIAPAQTISYLKGRPSIMRNLWALHPNRTTRRLRKLLVAWEKIGFFLSFSGTPPRLSATAENSFLKTKVTIAHSTSFLRFVEGMGNVGREAHEKEAEFTAILQRCPTLYTASALSREAKGELFYAWHSLYLFLHKVLGANPYEVSGQATPFRVVVPEKIEGASRRLGPLSDRKMA